MQPSQITVKFEAVIMSAASKVWTVNEFFRAHWQHVQMEDAALAAHIIRRSRPVKVLFVMVESRRGTKDVVQLQLLDN